VTKGSDVAEIATGAMKAIAVMNGNIFFMVFDATTSSQREFLEAIS
jgi:hypothetical protein